VKLPLTREYNHALQRFGFIEKGGEMRLQKNVVSALAVSMVCIAAHAVFAADRVIVNVDHASPPLAYDSSGEAKGILPLIIHAAFSAAGQEVFIRTRPWARVLKEAENGEAAGAGAVKTPEREQIYDFSDTLYTETSFIYYLASKPFRFASADDLSGLKVGIVRGSSYGESFDKAKNAQKFNIEQVASDGQNFKKLVAGRLDAVVSIVDSKKVLETYPQLAKSEQPLSESSVYLIIGKSSQKQGVLALFNLGLAKLKQEGRYISSLLMTGLKTNPERQKCLTRH
jgi:polar amino acid transport system substrate-binding protein